MVTKLYAFPIFVLCIFAISTTFAAAKSCTSKEVLCGECQEDDGWDWSTEDYIYGGGGGDYPIDPYPIYPYPIPIVTGEKCDTEVTKKCSKQMYKRDIDSFCCEKIFKLGEGCSKKILKALVKKVAKSLEKNNENKYEIKKKIWETAKYALDECKPYVRGH